MLPSRSNTPVCPVGLIVLPTLPLPPVMTRLEPSGAMTLLPASGCRAMPSGGGTDVTAGDGWLGGGS